MGFSVSVSMRLACSYIIITAVARRTSSPLRGSITCFAARRLRVVKTRTNRQGEFVEIFFAPQDCRSDAVRPRTVWKSRVISISFRGSVVYVPSHVFGLSAEVLFAEYV